MAQRQDLVAFLDLASEVLDVQRRVLEAMDRHHVVSIARDYGYVFEHHEIGAGAHGPIAEHGEWLQKPPSGARSDRPERGSDPGEDVN